MVDIPEKGARGKVSGDSSPGKGQRFHACPDWPLLRPEGPGRNAQKGGMRGGKPKTDFSLVE